MEEILQGSRPKGGGGSNWGWGGVREKKKLVGKGRAVLGGPVFRNVQEDIERRSVGAMRGTYTINN